MRLYFSIDLIPSDEDLREALLKGGKLKRYTSNVKRKTKAAKSEAVQPQPKPITIHPGLLRPRNESV